MSKLIAKLLTLLIIVALVPTAYASDTTPPADQIAENLTSSHFEWYNSARSDDFSITYVESGISATSGGVYVSATTKTNTSVHVIGGIASVQYWEDGSWKNYTQFYFEAYESSSCELNRNITVPGGYYYRLKITHTAEVGAEIKTKVSTTESVYVN